MLMAWGVEYTDEFGEWWNSLQEPEQDSIAVTVRLLQEKGPGLSFPCSSEVTGSRHGHMWELRIQQNPIVFFMPLIRAGRPFC